MYPELIKSPITEGKKYYLKKRPGTSTFETLPVGPSQGLFFWNGNYFAGVGGTLYADTTPILNFGTTNIIGFAEFRSDTEDLLFVCDGIHGWTITTALVATMITDANFPSPHIPMPVFLDGYIFLTSEGSQTIHNSTLQDPTTWPSDGFIDAEMFPDNIVAITKSQNYIAAIGSQSVEFLYDNANATGSPLQRNAPAVFQGGCPAPGTVNQTEMETIFVGDTDNGGRTVWVITGFQPKEIANAPVREALDLEGSAINLAWGYTVQISGHKFYVMNLSQSSRTFVYDFEEDMWHEWSFGTLQSAFPYRFVTGNVGTTGNPVLLGFAGGDVVVLDPNAFTDTGTVINCEVTTSKIDFDTIDRKRFYRLSLITDSPDADTSVPMTVNWSDDDYNTFVGNKTLEINGSYPTITQLGYGRRRAFQFIFQQPFPLRMEAFEVDIIQEVRR
jgi:hypothetical protein